MKEMHFSPFLPHSVDKRLNYNLLQIIVKNIILLQIALKCYILYTTGSLDQWINLSGKEKACIYAPLEWGGTRRGRNMGWKEKQTLHYVECGGLTAIKDQQAQMCGYSENKQIKRYSLDEKQAQNRL